MSWLDYCRADHDGNVLAMHWSVQVANASGAIDARLRAITRKRRKGWNYHDSDRPLRLVRPANIDVKPPKPIILTDHQLHDREDGCRRQRGTFSTALDGERSL